MAGFPGSGPSISEELYVTRAELTAADEADGPEEIRAVWQRLDELATAVAAKFPLNGAECEELRASLKAKILAIYEAETAAHAALGEALA